LRVLASKAFVSNPLPDEQKTTPAGCSRGVTSEVLCVRYNPKAVKLVLSVQQEWNLRSGIVRGHRNSDGFLMMDYIIGPRGERLFGADMRTGTISVWSHQEKYLSQKREGTQRIAAIMGYGNLTQNPYFVAWFGTDGLLIRLKPEPISDRIYDCVVVDENHQVTLESLRFKRDSSIEAETGWQAINVATDKFLPDSTQVAFSGQRIVKSGQAMSRQEFSEQICSGLFYDLRHVFRFPAVPSGAYWRDLGLEQFYTQGSIDPEVVIKALNNSPITTRWKDLTDDETAVRKALADKGYQESDEGKPGTYRLYGSFVDIVFLDAIYCHDVIGIDKEQGNLCSMHVTGWSNNVGATLQGLSQLAANVFQDAILLNNGGDVFYLINHDPKEKMLPDNKLDNANWTVVASCENRYYTRGALLFITDHPPQDNAEWHDESLNS